MLVTGPVDGMRVRASSRTGGSRRPRGHANVVVVTTTTEEGVTKKGTIQLPLTRADA